MEDFMRPTVKSRVKQDRKMKLPTQKRIMRKRVTPKTTKKQSSKPLVVKESVAPYGRHLSSLSLFSGGGGMDIGVESAGFKNLACVEFDPNAAETLRYNTSRKKAETKIFESDVRTLDPLVVAKPGIDLLHGGPPCQSFSLIGKRGSLSDARGLLLFEMIRFAAALKPKAILLEQVKGLLSAPNERGEVGGVFKRFIRELEDLGYCVKWAVLCAADYGIPQLRERVFNSGPN
jgi:DNA (cytosine-5)-methyltransferase 1